MIQYIYSLEIKIKRRQIKLFMDTALGEFRTAYVVKIKILPKIYRQISNNNLN